MLTETRQFDSRGSVEVRPAYRVRPASHLIKRFVDLVLVLLTLPVWGSACLLISVVLATTTSGPVFYVQRRVGRDLRPIEVYKFRTMRENAEQLLEDLLSSDRQLRDQWLKQCKLENDPRVTRVGQFLRKTSLDELPQLWNVLIGDMSLVGPRPFPDYHLQIAPADFVRARQSVMPGLTGLWQVNGRCGEIKSVIQHDSEYLAKRSLFLDLWLLMKTVQVVWRREGAV